MSAPFFLSARRALMARWITSACILARRLLLLAFASECLDRMREGPARAHVEHVIQDSIDRLEKHAPHLASSAAADETVAR